MNTSANTEIRLLRRSVVGALLAAAITATGVALAATSHADDAAPAPDVASPALGNANCTTEPWGFLGSQRRTLCDGPINTDGSWSRERTIWAPAHRTPYHCYSYGSHDHSTDCYGGDFVEQRVISSEIYPVRPDTVLSDEPGHLN